MSIVFWNDKKFNSSSFGMDFRKTEEDGCMRLGGAWCRTVRIPNYLETHTVESVYSVGDPELLPEKAVSQCDVFAHPFQEKSSRGIWLHHCLQLY